MAQQDCRKLKECYKVYASEKEFLSSTQLISQSLQKILPDCVWKHDESTILYNL